MDKKIISTEQAPKAIGPYSQAVLIGSFLYTSGQIPLDAVSGQVVDGGIREQAYKVFENLKAVLTDCGADFTNVVKTTVFLSDMNHFAAMNEIYAEYFKSPYPARSCVEVGRLPKDVLIEIELVAAID